MVEICQIDDGARGLMMNGWRGIAGFLMRYAQILSEVFYP